MVKKFLVSCAMVIMAASSSFALDEFVGPFSTWLNVKTDFHAVGDGSTDDWQAIQNALDSLHEYRIWYEDSFWTPRVLYFPAGTYNISKSLQFPRFATGVKRVLQARIVGEDPSKVTIKWAGTTGTYMIWTNGAPYTSWERMTWDGSGTISEAMEVKWSAGVTAANTGCMYIDNVYKNVAYGVISPNANHQMDAEQYFERCQFINCSSAAIQVNSANSMNWFIWNCTFQNCGIGVQSVSYGYTFVNNCKFSGSTVADLANAFSARECYSQGSKKFSQSNGLTINNVRSFYNNIIVDPIDQIAIQENAWQLYLVDNVIRSSASVSSGTVVQHSGGHLVAVGNTFTATNPISSPGANVYTAIDNSSVSRSSITPVEPTWPGFRTKVSRRIFEVPVDTTTARKEYKMQIAIDSAVAYSSANPGSRPVVHFGGHYWIKSTVTIPANTDIQIMADGFNNIVHWGGTNGSPMFLVNGPTKLTMSYFWIVGENKMDNLIVVRNCDQVGSRIFFSDVDLGKGMFVNGVTNASITGQPWFSGTFKILGPSNSTGTSRTALFGAANMAGTPTFELVNGGKLIVQDAYSEMLPQFNANQFLYAHGQGAQAGQFVAEITSNAAEGQPTNQVFYKLDDWPGHASFLMGNYERNATLSATTTTIADQMNLMSVGCYFPQPTTTPSSSQIHIGLFNRGANLSSGSAGAGATFRSNVTDSIQFIRDGMAFRRANKHLTLPLAAVPSGASDIQIFRVIDQSYGGTRSFDVVVEGANCDTMLQKIPSLTNAFNHGDFEDGTVDTWQKGGMAVIDTIAAERTEGNYSGRLKNAGSYLIQWVGGWGVEDSTDNWYAECDVKVPAGNVAIIRMWCSNGLGDDTVALNGTTATSKYHPGLVTTSAAPNGFLRVKYALGHMPLPSFQLVFGLYNVSGTNWVATDNWRLYNEAMVSPVHFRTRALMPLNPVVFTQRGSIICKGLPPQAQVQVFNAAGQLASSRKMSSTVPISTGGMVINNLSGGVYIVKIQANKFVWRKNVFIVK